MEDEQSFTTTVKIAGINPYVDVAEHVVKQLGGGPRAAVLVKVAATGPTEDKAATAPNTGRLATGAAHLKAIRRLAPGDWFRTTLVPLRSQPTRLYLDKWMRQVAGVDVGDSVRVTLKPDRGSRELPMPAALRQALTGKAKAAWEALAPSRRREILTYLNFLKTPAALERNVQKTIAELLARDDLDACPDCGAVVSGGKAGCEKLFEEVIAREFADYRYGRVHRLTVDTYSLQHPEPYLRSGKSFAAHLTGMYAALEGEDTSAINQAVRRWLDGPKVLERPAEPLPLKRGELTILYVHRATEAEEHVQRVREWARSTWEAWSAYHALAKEWVDQACIERKKP